MINSDTPDLSLSVIEDLKSKGFNQSQIAEMFGRTRQAVSWHVKVYNGSQTPRQIVLQEWPFEVPLAQQLSPYKRLRDHGEYMATGGNGMSEDKLQRLRSFYRKLREENVVVEFDPSIPPMPGVSNKGGWAFRKRLPKDEDLLIRANRHANITEQGRMIWRFPPTDP
jgi:hypothetical protein